MGQLGRFRRQLSGKSPPKSSPSLPDNSGCIDLDIGTLEKIIERSKQKPLSEQDCQLLRSVVETLHVLTQELEKKHVSVQKLKQMLFGATTESTRKVLEKLLESDKPPPADKDQAPENPETSPPPKPPGHGRNGADAYSGAETVRIKHESLKPGDPCPNCHTGTVYKAKPSRLVRLRGQAPLGAKVVELEKVRCGLCGAIFTAQAPPDVGSEKYDAESAGMIALLKYGSGFPFNVSFR
jgi:transposase